jgi:arylformamidase
MKWGRIHDISMTIEEGMQVWKNYAHKKPSIAAVQTHQEGKPHESLLTFNSHTGTHVDAPLHMLPGRETIETITLEQLCGEARVLDLTHVKGHIAKEDLKGHGIRPGERILLKTSSSLTEDFDPDFPYLRQDGAEYLAEIGVSLVGTDALGIERAQPEYPTHRTLMRKGIIIIEGLRLKDVEAGSYFMIAAPLKLAGIDAAPARVFLVESGE